MSEPKTAPEGSLRYPRAPSVLYAALEALQPGFRDLPNDAKVALARAVEIAWWDSAAAGNYAEVGSALTDLHQVIGEELDEAAKGGDG